MQSYCIMHKARWGLEIVCLELLAVSWIQSYLHGKYPASRTMPRCTHSWEVMQMEQPRTMHGCAVHLGWWVRTQRLLACHLKLQQHSRSIHWNEKPWAICSDFACCSEEQAQLTVWHVWSLGQLMLTKSKRFCL